MEFKRALVKENNLPVTRFNTDTQSPETVKYGLLNSYIDKVNDETESVIELIAAETIIIPSIWTSIGNIMAKKGEKQSDIISNKISDLLNRGISILESKSDMTAKAEETPKVNLSKENIKTSDDCYLQPVEVHTGLEVNFSKGEALGLFNLPENSKKGILLFGGDGLLQKSGDLKVNLINIMPYKVTINSGDKIVKIAKIKI